MSTNETSDGIRSGYLPVADEFEPRIFARIFAEVVDWPEPLQAQLGRILAGSQEAREALGSLDDLRDRYGLEERPESLAQAYSLSVFARYALGPGWESAELLGAENEAGFTIDEAATRVFGAPEIEGIVPLEEVLRALESTAAGGHPARISALRDELRERYAE